MPTYDYECQKCGDVFELFQSIKADPIKKCPKCKGKVIRLIGKGAGIIFKGSGFYHTDYKNKGSEHKCPADKNDNSACKSCKMKKD